MRGGKLLQEEPSEQAREHAYGEEEAGPAGDPALAIKRDAAARHNHVDMRMVGERRAPGVEDGEDADAGAEVFGIGRDGDQGLGRGLEQDVVDRGLVVVRFEPAARTRRGSTAPAVARLHARRAIPSQRLPAIWGNAGYDRSCRRSAYGRTSRSRSARH